MTCKMYFMYADLHDLVRTVYTTYQLLHYTAVHCCKIVPKYVSKHVARPCMLTADRALHLNTATDLRNTEKWLRGTR